ncbi:hypothetical protein BV898_18651 [Hypsibius exemplaris]|uniref:Uncharacterized protein n=1 Tax=Hypsibius exemplaris TaxID=2072580 RepID=A0A9X6NHB6_HYPEX|nr:hypothetical protein BV898_18651 [Hypsibius exemplaris]
MYLFRTDGVVKTISPAAARYVWVQAKLANLVPLLPYNEQGDTDVLEIIRAKLQDDNMPDNFICFLLVYGQTNILSLHYQELLHTFGHIQALSATGPRTLRDLYANDHFPLILHDCKNLDTIVTALMECFEGKDVQKHESQQAPGTTLSVTCNKRTMKYLQSNFAALSRAVMIPMLEEMSPMTEVQLSDVLRGKQTAAKHFPALLNLTEEDKRELKKRAFGLQETVTNAMSGVTDSHHRISKNYSILTAATGKGRRQSCQYAKSKVSPFKALDAPVPPRNSLEPVHVPPQFEPVGTSTPNAASANLRSPRNFRSPVGNPGNLVADVSAIEEESLGDLDNQVPQPTGAARVLSATSCGTPNFDTLSPPLSLPIFRVSWANVAAYAPLCLCKRWERSFPVF